MDKSLKYLGAYLMSIFIAALLGLVQGLCEFLPVSSSGHLVLLQTVFGISEGALFFDTMLHVGTLVAVFAVFYKEIWGIIRHPIQIKTGLLIIATVVTAVCWFLFEDFFVAAFQGGYLGFGFLITSVILFVSCRLGSASNSIEATKWYKAAGIGLMQGIAIVPGISRSGSTIAGARFMGMEKAAAAEFSFLLSIPAILGSAVLQIPDVIREGAGGISAGAMIVGAVAAAVSGYFAIRVMLRLIIKKSLIGFSVYTGILGLAVLADKFIFHLFF